VILTVRAEATPGQEDRLARFLAEEALPQLFDQPGVVGAHFGVADRSGSEIETMERKARGNLTLVPGWVILVEGVSQDAVEAAVRGLEGLDAHGGHGPLEHGTYRLECALSHAGHTS
jgi:hypothetical protein